MKYKKPSIAEALCEFKFKQGEEPWDNTVFGDFKRLVSTELNGKRENLENVQVHLEKDDIVPKIDREPQMRFWSADQTKVAHVARNLVSANVLNPYPGWNNFRPFIEWIFKQYKAAAKPGEVTKVTLRYIDRVNLPGEGFKLGDWIDCEGNYLPAALSEITDRLVYRFVRPIGENKHLGFNLRLNVIEDNKRNLTLDTEAFCDKLEDENRLDETLDFLHDEIIENFEGSITNKFREFLQPVGD